MLTVLTFSLIFAIVVLARQVFAAQPKMQAIKIKQSIKQPKRKY